MRAALSTADAIRLAVEHGDIEAMWDITRIALGRGDFAELIHGVDMLSSTSPEVAIHYFDTIFDLLNGNREHDDELTLSLRGLWSKCMEPGRAEIDRRSVRSALVPTLMLIDRAMSRQAP